MPILVTKTSLKSNEKIYFAIVGPFKYGTAKKYGLTIQDDLTKFTKFVGIPNTKSKTIAKYIIEEWITNFGIPKIMISDNGTNLCGTVMQLVAQYFAIQHKTTAAAHRNSDGADDINWEMKMKLASHCYNTTYHQGIKCTPHELMFGTNPRIF